MALHMGRLFFTLDLCPLSSCLYPPFYLLSHISIACPFLGRLLFPRLHGMHWPVLLPLISSLSFQAISSGLLFLCQTTSFCVCRAVASSTDRSLSGLSFSDSKKAARTVHSAVSGGGDELSGRCACSWMLSVWERMVSWLLSVTFMSVSRKCCWQLAIQSTGFWMLFWMIFSKLLGKFTL